MWEQGLRVPLVPCQELTLESWGKTGGPLGEGSDCHGDFYQEGLRQLPFTKEVGNILTVTIVSLGYAQ